MMLIGDITGILTALMIATVNEEDHTHTKRLAESIRHTLHLNGGIKTVAAEVKHLHQLPA